ncbi:hypothetical protein WDU94_012609 [Cyamophila willieti]
MSMSTAELSKQLVLFQYQLQLVTTILNDNVELANRYHGKLSTLFGGVEEKARLLLDVMSLAVMEERIGQQGEEKKYRDLVRETVSALGLNPVPIYSELVKLLAKQSRVHDIKDLILCLKPDLRASCDDMLMGAIRFKPALVEQLISLVSKIPLQISLFIETGKLKSAYLLAVKHNRLDDIRLIAQQAKRLDQSAILNICLKKIEFEESKFRRDSQNRGGNSKPLTHRLAESEDISKTLVSSPEASTSNSRTYIRSGIQLAASQVSQDNQATRTDRTRDTSGRSQDMIRKSDTSTSQSSDTSFSDIAAVLRAYEQQRTPSNQSIRSSGKSSSDKISSSDGKSNTSDRINRSLKHTPSDRSLKQKSTQGTPKTPPTPYNDIASVLKAYEQKRLKNSNLMESPGGSSSSSQSSRRQTQGTPESSSRRMPQSYTKKDSGSSSGKTD